MILTRNKLILGISYFLLIVNLLALLDLEFFYIRAILVFVFLITVPGLLIMLCFKIRNIRFWEYLVYTVGLSVAFFIIIPFTFPFLAVIGAFILNNHGPNYVSMALLGAIAVYVLLVVIFRDKLNKNVYPWALYMIGLSLF